MVPNSDQVNEEPKQPDEVTRKLVVVPVAEEFEPDGDRSPSKVDRDGKTDNLESTAPKSPEVVRKLVVPESVAVEVTSDDDRSPGKTERTAIVPEATDAKPAEKVRKPILPDDSLKS